jgi:hypothetical protein
MNENGALHLETIRMKEELQRMSQDMKIRLGQGDQEKSDVTFLAA